MRGATQCVALCCRGHCPLGHEPVQAGQHGQCYEHQRGTGRVHTLARGGAAAGAASGTALVSQPLARVQRHRVRPTAFMAAQLLWRAARVAAVQAQLRSQGPGGLWACTLLWQCSTVQQEAGASLILCRLCLGPA